MIAELTATRAAARDDLYRGQQVMAHEEALRLHAGYAASGSSPAPRTSALNTSAAAAAPIVSGHDNRPLDMNPRP